MKILVNCVNQINFYEFQMATSVVVFGPLVHQKNSKNKITIERYF